VVTQASWVILVFPAWVFLVSAYILVASLRGDLPTDRDTASSVADTDDARETRRAR
jgi:hypothetical protein